MDYISDYSLWRKGCELQEKAGEGKTICYATKKENLKRLI